MTRRSRTRLAPTAQEATPSRSRPARCSTSSASPRRHTSQNRTGSPGTTTTGHTIPGSPPAPTSGEWYECCRRAGGATDIRDPAMTAPLASTSEHGRPRTSETSASVSDTVAARARPRSSPAIIAAWCTAGCITSSRAAAAAASMSGTSVSTRTVPKRSASRRVAIPVADTAFTATRPAPPPSLTLRRATSSA